MGHHQKASANAGAAVTMSPPKWRPRCPCLAIRADRPQINDYLRPIIKTKARPVVGQCWGREEPDAIQRQGLFCCAAWPCWYKGDVEEPKRQFSPMPIRGPRLDTNPRPLSRAEPCAQHYRARH